MSTAERRASTAPERTGNSYLLAGYIAGVVFNRRDTYDVVEAGNPLVVEHRETGNRYHVTVEQVSGVE